MQIYVSDILRTSAIFAVEEGRDFCEVSKQWEKKLIYSKVQGGP